MRAGIGIGIGPTLLLGRDGDLTQFLDKRGHPVSRRGRPSKLKRLLLPIQRVFKWICPEATPLTVGVRAPNRSVPCIGSVTDHGAVRGTPLRRPDRTRRPDRRFGCRNLVGRPRCALCGCTATSAAFCWLVADLSRVDDQRAAATEAHWLRYGLESASG